MTKYSKDARIEELTRKCANMAEEINRLRGKIDRTYILAEELDNILIKATTKVSAIIRTL